MLAPIVIVPAPPHSTVPPDDRTIAVNGTVVGFRTMMAYAALSILSGVPATAFPIGMSRDGLPISCAVHALLPLPSDAAETVVWMSQARRLVGVIEEGAIA